MTKNATYYDKHVSSRECIVFVVKILIAFDGKYDTLCTLIQMMPNYKNLKPTEVIRRIVAHEMSLKDKGELHNKASGAYKASCDAPTS